MIPFLRVLRVLMALVSIGAFLSYLSVLSLLPDSGLGRLFTQFHVQGALLGILGLIGVMLSPSGGGGQGSLRGATLCYAVLGAGLAWLEPAPQAPAWAVAVLSAGLPAFLVLDWFWSPPPSKTGFGVAALWLLYPAAYVGWALSQPSGRPYALLDSKVGGEQNAGLFLVASAVLALTLVALVRLRQKDEETSPGYRPSKGLRSRDQDGPGLR